MKKLLIASTLIAGSLFGGEAPLKFGIVNFTTCVTDSKLGKQEQSSFETMKKQMTALIEDTEKQLREIAEKGKDKDFLDGLSPEAQQELNAKFQNLSEELNRYQQQYYQVMQQANFKMIQTLGANINSAAEKVAAAKGLNMVVNKDACFYYLNSFDVTADVIKEMDKTFDKEGKTALAPAPEAKEAAKPQAKVEAKK
jgi:outer membrane protein